MKKISTIVALLLSTLSSFSQVTLGKAALTLRGQSDDVNSIAITAAGRMIATGSYDNKICLYTEEGGFLRTVLAHNASVEALCFSKDGKYLFSGSNDATAKQIDASTGTIMRGFNGHVGNVTAVAVDPNSKVFFTGGEDGTVRFWDLEKGGEQTKSITVGSRINSICTNADGKYLLVACNNMDVQIYDMTGKLTSTYKGHKDFVNSVACSMNGKYIVSGSNDKTAILWDPKTGQKVREFVGHVFKVNSVFISFDSRYLITGSNDGTAKIWEMDNGKEIYTIANSDNKVRGAVITFEKKYAVTASPQKKDADAGARAWLLGLDSVDKRYIKVTQVTPIPVKETPKKPETKKPTETKTEKPSNPEPDKNVKPDAKKPTTTPDGKKVEQPRVGAQESGVTKPEVSQIPDTARLRMLPTKDAAGKMRKGAIDSAKMQTKPKEVTAPPASTKPADKKAPETKPEGKPETKPEGKPETKPEGKPNPKSKGKAETLPSGKPEPPKTEVKDTTENEPAPEAPKNDGWKSSRFKKLK
jgi:WD40 repeat protein